uniref:gamma-glutamylcyclotransferase family protein n=1 Tax=Dyella sp. ASV21 TaxID=2795114 RepID=UPI0018EA4929
VLKTSGKAHHPIDRHTGAADAHVHGTAFVVSEEELAQADAYEVAAYVRVLAPLASGDTAWVYVDRRHAPVA